MAAELAVLHIGQQQQLQQQQHVARMRSQQLSASPSPPTRAVAEATAVESTHLTACGSSNSSGSKSSSSSSTSNSSGSSSSSSSNGSIGSSGGSEGKETDSSDPPLDGVFSRSEHQLLKQMEHQSELPSPGGAFGTGTAAASLCGDISKASDQHGIVGVDYDEMQLLRRFRLIEYGAGGDDEVEGGDTTEEDEGELGVSLYVHAGSSSAGVGKGSSPSSSGNKKQSRYMCRCSAVTAMHSAMRQFTVTLFDAFARPKEAQVMGGVRRGEARRCEWVQHNT